MVIDISARLIFGLFAITILGLILALVRIGLVKEKYTLLWVPIGIGFSFFCLFPNLLLYFANAIHLHYITVVLMFVILIFTVILLYLTIKLSEVKDDIQKLAQEQALHRATSNVESHHPKDKKMKVVKKRV